jgi:hypothetical protein
LKPEEITKIKQWITGGIPQGNGVAPTPPSFNSGSQLTNIDASLSTLNYTVSTNVDDYKTFVIPSNNSTKRYQVYSRNNAVELSFIVLF